MEKKELQDGKGKTERCNTKMLNKAECPMLKLIICKIMTFYHAAYFSWGTRASGIQDAWKQREWKGVEGHELPQAFPRPPMTVFDLHHGLIWRAGGLPLELRAMRQSGTLKV